MTASFCPNCGSPVAFGVPYCPRCGASQTPAAANPALVWPAPNRQRTPVALIVAAVVGVCLLAGAGVALVLSRSSAGGDEAEQGVTTTVASEVVVPDQVGVDPLEPLPEPVAEEPSVTVPPPIVQPPPTPAPTPTPGPTVATGDCPAEVRSAAGDSSATIAHQYTTAGFVITICEARSGTWYHGSDRDEVGRTKTLPAEFMEGSYAAFSGDVSYFIDEWHLVVLDGGEVILDQPVLSGW